MAEIVTAIALRHPQRLGVGMTVVIEPGPIVVAVALDDQRVAVPASDRVTHPRRIWIPLERAAVHVDLTIGEIGVEDQDERRRLDDFHLLGTGRIGRRHVARSERYTDRVHVALAKTLAA